MSNTPKNNSSNTRRMNKNSRYDDKPKKRFNKKKLLLFIGIPILLLLTTGISYAVHLYTTAQKTAEDSFENIEREEGVSNLRENAVDPVEDNVSVLILGVDEGDERSEDGYFRTDAMMLATFNKEKGSVKLLTIPRDSYTYVPEVDRYTKINHAHSYGGAESAIDAVEDFLHVPVDYYARVNFNAFIDTVDSLDGIYYDVPYDIEEMDEHDNKGAIELSEGYQKLDGKEALALARTRKYDNDIERGKRQQEILKTIADDATSASSILKLDDVMGAVGDNLTTNLTFDHMKSFLSYGIDNDFSIESIELDGEGGYLNDGLWYYVADSEARMEASNKLREQLDMEDIGLNVFQDGTNDAINQRSNKNYAEQEPGVDQEEPDPYETTGESQESQHQEQHQPSEPEQPEQPSSPSKNQAQGTPNSPSEPEQGTQNSSESNEDNQETEYEDEDADDAGDQEDKNSESVESEKNADENSEENDNTNP